MGKVKDHLFEDGKYQREYWPGEGPPVPYQGDEGMPEDPKHPANLVLPVESYDVEFIEVDDDIDISQMTPDEQVDYYWRSYYERLPEEEKKRLAELNSETVEIPAASINTSNPLTAMLKRESSVEVETPHTEVKTPDMEKALAAAHAAHYMDVIPGKQYIQLVSLIFSQRPTMTPIEAHIIGSILKYTLRVGQKPGVMPEQDALKIVRWGEILVQYYSEGANFTMPASLK